MHRLTKYILYDVSPNLIYRNFCISSNQVVRRVPHTKDEYLKLFSLLPPENRPDSKVLKISVVGCPNSGKSSLVNMLTRWNVCAVSGKMNTTRTKQTAIYTEENVQLCFIDLPGLVGQRRKFQFKLEKSLIRDPHSGVFDSDLILVVIDVSHLSSRKELPLDVMKLLHYFKDKPSILVLNKVDSVSKQSKLFKITYNLTRGVVGGNISHIDKYANRSRKDIPGYLDLISDQRIQLLMQKHKDHLLPSQTNQNQELLESSNEISVSEPVSSELTNEISVSEPDSISEPDSSEPTKEISVSEPDSLEPNNEISVSEPDSSQSTNEDADELSSLPIKDEAEYQLKKILELTDMTIDDELKEPILDVLKKQLMLTSASKQEVIERRKKWWQITRQLELSKEMSWKQFDEVFAVSSMTGRGIDKLRSYLVSRAKPGRWYFHSSLVSDTEPEELARLVLRARCLDSLSCEIPYSLDVVIEQFDKAPDGSLQIEANIKCHNRREIMAVIGKEGSVISSISDSAREQMEISYQAPVSLKVVVTRLGVEKSFKHRMKRVANVSQMYPPGANKT